MLAFPDTPEWKCGFCWVDVWSFEINKSYLQEKTMSFLGLNIIWNSFVFCVVIKARCWIFSAFCNGGGWSAMPCDAKVVRLWHLQGSRQEYVLDNANIADPAATLHFDILWRLRQGLRVRKWHTWHDVLVMAGSWFLGWWSPIYFDVKLLGRNGL